MNQVLVNNQISFKEVLGAQESKILTDLAQSAKNRLDQIGFPGRKSEDWKYTKTAQLFKNKYISAESSEDLKLAQLSIPEIKCPTLVIENGAINEKLTCLTDLEGLTILSFDLLNTAQIKKIGTISNDKSHPFSLLNLSHLQTGVFIHVGANKKIDQPLHVVFVNSKKQVFSNTRLFVQLDQGAEFKMVQSFVNKQAQDAFVNHVSEFELAKESHLFVEKIQDVGGESHICSEYAKQQDNSEFRINTFSNSGKLIRNGLNIFVDGENCSTYLNGLFVPSEKEHIDNHTHLEHIQPNCFSSECYKGIVNHSASGVFNGKVIVHQDAQKIMAYQQNNNILLTDQASVYAKPELEIYADDVKCSHGSTTGQLDEQALFYLQARGISKVSALELLMAGFVQEVLDNVQIEEVKSYYDKKIASLLLSN